MARVRSPNNSGPVAHRAHPERDNASDPRRPYTDRGKLPETKTDGKGFVNARFSARVGRIIRINTYRRGRAMVFAADLSTSHAIADASARQTTA